MNCSKLAFIYLIWGCTRRKIEWGSVTRISLPLPYLTESGIFPALFMTLKSSFFKKDTPSSRLQNHMIFMTKMAHIDTPFITKTAENHIIWGHRYLGP